MRRVFAERELVDCTADAVEVDGMVIRNFDDRPAAKIDAEVEPPG